jgi:DNA-binding winged helix-turn-helix (wHTH) protein
MSTKLAFGPFVLDIERGTLVREGRPVPLSSRGFELLKALVAAPGAVVPKRDLMQAAWRDAAVEESNLSVQIAALRKQLGPAPDGGEWIATAARSGYRFVGQVAAQPARRLGGINAYLENAKMLRPELERVAGFVDNIRYKSLTREGWILSLSGWPDEKAVVRWRTAMRHHIVQEKGRSEILLDYHLRVGQVTHDTLIPVGQTIEEQRLDETEIGEGMTITFVDAKQPANLTEAAAPSETAAHLGFNEDAVGLVGWDVYKAVLEPGDLMLIMAWRTKAEAQMFAEPRQAA